MAALEAVVVDLLEGGVGVDVPRIGYDGVLVVRIVVVDEAHDRFRTLRLDALKVAYVVVVEAEYQIKLVEVFSFYLTNNTNNNQTMK